MAYRTDNYDPFCSKCSLSSDKAIHSYANCRFEEALLFIVSDYPSNLEEKSGIPFTETTKEGEINGGKFLRKLLSDLFDKDERIPTRFNPFIDNVVLGNVIRCNPTRGKEVLKVEPKHLYECHYWLDKDLAKIHPHVPILVSGSKALMSVLDKDMRVNSSRRQIYMLDTHPVVVCENFANGARYLTKEVTSTFKRRKDGLDMPSPKASKVIPPVPLSSPWCLIQDMKLIRELVVDFIRKYKVDNSNSTK